MSRPPGGAGSPADGTYDVVIVGGGTAGCVLAGRLSEDPDCTVCLLEAGPERIPWEARIPAAFSRLFRTEVDWAHRTLDQEGLDGRRLYWPRGRMVGGCSSMNAQIHVRGHGADFRGWVEAGAAGWGPGDVLPWFIRSEDAARAPAPGRGSGGPLPVVDLPSPNPVTGAFLEAASRAGIPAAEDLAGVVPEGAAVAPVNQRAGRRWSAREAYLEPARSRPNLAVRAGCTAIRVMMEGGRAMGIAYRDAAGRLRIVRATDEAVLSAGAVGSPRLLMLSGLGPAGHLEDCGLPVVRDLPGVGENLQDHLAVGIAVRCSRPVTLEGAETLRNLLRWRITGSGPLASNVAEGLAFVRTDPGLEAPDLELLCAPVGFLDHGFRPVDGHALTVGAVCLRPESRGRVRLPSADPVAEPLIDPGYLSDPDGRDRRLLEKGLERCLDLLGRRPLDSLVAGPLEPSDPAPDGDALSVHLGRHAQTLYHPVGTCRMGEGAVVDSRLRVRGVEGLRVVDASVMPTLVRGHTHAATVMIAERAASWIGGTG